MIEPKEVNKLAAANKVSDRQVEFDNHTYYDDYCFTFPAGSKDFTF